MNFELLTIFNLRKLFKQKKASPIEVANYFLSRIAKQDKKINAFLSVDEKKVIAQAKKAEENFTKQDETNFLTGIPAAIKDNILIKNSITTAGSKILENYHAPYDATVIKMLKEKGPVVIMGKTNLDEFAMGSSTEHSAFYPTKNPHDIKRVPGGSSGGSAAAVAAGECLFSLGSETNGSVRLPAAFCGIVGLKPTYRSVSRSGLIAMASSLDVIGPMAKTVKEVALIFEAISGKDNLDSTSFEDYDVLKHKQLFNRDPKKLRIGIPKEYFPKEIDPVIRQRIEKIINKLANKRFNIQTVSLPLTEYALATYYIIMPAEVSANLARYDGIRYGLSVRAKKEKNILDTYLNSRKNGFGLEVKRRIILGTYVLSSGYYDAYYAKAQEVRELIKKEFEEVFKQVDVLLTPVAPSLPFKFGAKTNPVDMYLTDIFTSPSSLAGLPAISLPSGKINGLPTAIQIIGRLFREEDIFVLANYIEKALRD